VILVIGGRSKFGSALLELLAARGETLRVLVRDREREESLPAGVEAVVGDLSSPQSLHVAMSGVARVLLLSSPHRDAVQWHCNAIADAAAAGVALLVRSSIIGADADSPARFVSAHGQCDRHVEQSGLDHVILRPILFLQNIPKSDDPVDRRRRPLLHQCRRRADQQGRQARRRCGRERRVDRGGHVGERYDITGPEALSYQSGSNAGMSRTSPDRPELASWAGTRRCSLAPARDRLATGA